MTDTPLSRCRVVLVRPQLSGNIGSTARVMANLGMRDLALVAPEADPRDLQARQFSTHGEFILDRARIVPDLGAAVADCTLVAATSARKGGLFRRQSVVPPEEAAAKLVESLPSGPVALVFGPERSGLTDEEVARCHYLIHIPTDPAHPALNLAQAVAVCLYEVRRAWLRTSCDSPVSPREPVAPFKEQKRTFEDLRKALEEIHYLRGIRGEALMHALRHLIGRAGPSSMEMKLLIGLARQIHWCAARMTGDD